MTLDLNVFSGAIAGGVTGYLTATIRINRWRAGRDMITGREVNTGTKVSSSSGHAAGRDVNVGSRTRSRS